MVDFKVFVHALRQVPCDPMRTLLRSDYQSTAPADKVAVSLAWLDWLLRFIFQQTSQAAMFIPLPIVPSIPILLHLDKFNFWFKKHQDKLQAD